MIFEPGRNMYFSTYPQPRLIHLSHRFTSASKPAAQKADCCLSHLRFNFFVIVGTFATQLWTALRDKHFAPKTGHTFIYANPLHQVFCPQKCITERRISVVHTLKHGSHFDHWNHSLRKRRRVCYLDCHEAGLCCYLVIQETYSPFTGVLLQFVTCLLTPRHTTGTKIAIEHTVPSFRKVACWRTTYPQRRSSHIIYTIPRTKKKCISLHRASWLNW
jgi:hypothetical protein